MALPEIELSSQGLEPGTVSRRAAVAAILLIEIGLFSSSSTKFFCGDSLYFLWRRVAGWDQLRDLFTTIDTLHTYRPMTNVVFTYLMYPLSGLDPRGYHVMSLAAHLLASLGAYALLRRLVRAPAAALAGLFFFGAHAVNFYITYDASFLPDYGMGLLGVASLWAFARSLGSGMGIPARPLVPAMGKAEDGQECPSYPWRAVSVVLFALALLFKESAVALPVGMLVVAALERRRGGERLTGRSLLSPMAALAPHLVLAAAYMAFQFYLRQGSLYPRQNLPYQLSFAPSVLFLKLKYLLWLFNFPADLERRGWLLAPPALVMLPAALWILGRLRGAWREERPALLLCGAWALAALLPALFVAQAPMKHNLYLSVLVAAVALAVSVDRETTPERLLPHRAAWLFVPLAASVALQVRTDLKYSWAGEGSDIAESSLAAVRRAYPTLPTGAVLYVLLAGIKGNVSWYFDGGSLFSLFYNDPSLEMRFADLKQALPENYLRRDDVFVFRFFQGRLYDVTREFKLEGAGRPADQLLARLDAAEIKWRSDWKPEDLYEGRPVRFLYLARGDALRRALAMLPGTEIRFPIRNLPPETVLRLGVTVAGGMNGGTSARVSFEGPARENPETLLRISLDASLDGDTWWDGEVDLSRLAGRSGVLAVESDADRTADWVAWSDMRLAPRSDSLQEYRYGRPLRERGLRLLDYLDQAQLTFDRSEVYPNYDRFSTPTGRPCFLWWATRARPSHLSLVTIAGARVRFAVPTLPPDAVLEVSATYAGELGDGGRGRTYWEHDGQRELLFDQMAFPKQTYWVDRDISLARWAGKAGTLSFECSSGPAGNTIGDWFAWGRLRIVSRFLTGEAQRTQK